MHLNNDFTETAVTRISDGLGTMNIGDGTAADRLAGFGIKVLGTPRLYDGRTDPAMRPGGRAKSMVVPEHQPNVNIHPPAVTHKFSTDDFSGFMSMGHPLGKSDLVLAILRRTGLRRHGLDPAGVLAVRHFDTNNDIGPNVERRRMLCHLNFNRTIARFCSF